MEFNSGFKGLKCALEIEKTVWVFESHLMKKWMAVTVLLLWLQ